MGDLQRPTGWGTSGGGGLAAKEVREDADWNYALPPLPVGDLREGGDPAAEDKVDEWMRTTASW